MKLQQRLQKKIKRLILFTNTLRVTTGSFGQSLTNLVIAIPVTTKSADDFVESMCVDTHWDYDNTPYKKN